jgi:hypothetical protein
MCFGPSKAEIAAMEESNRLQAEAAATQRRDADDAARAEAERKAKQKQDDIATALDRRKGGGIGRRTLFTSGSAGKGFLGRFG